MNDPAAATAKVLALFQRRTPGHDLTALEIINRTDLPLEHVTEILATLERDGRLVQHRDGFWRET